MVLMHLPHPICVKWNVNNLKQELNINLSTSKEKCGVAPNVTFTLTRNGFVRGVQILNKSV